MYFSCPRIKMLKHNICSLRSPGVRVKEINHDEIERSIPPELQCACIYWVHQYRQSGTILRDGDCAHGFLLEHFLHWVEAIDQIEKSSEMAAIIRMYQSLLVVCVHAY